MTRLPVVAALLCAALLLPAAPASFAQEATPTPTPRECVEGDPDGYERVVDLTFPVSGGTRGDFSDTYDAPRSGGRVHQATDVMGRKLQGVHAVLPGKVVVATGIGEPVPSYGYYLKIEHDNGLQSVYVHLNNDSPGTDDGAGGPEWAYAPGIREGVRVERGQWIGYVGDSGNAESTGSHLHFELHDPAMDDPCLEGYKNKSWMSPYPSLVDAWDRGDVPEPPAGDVTRVAGSNRVLTSIMIARRFDPGVRAVIVVPEGSHAEALVAAPLAGLLDSPILLAGTAGPSDEALTEVRRLGARNAYVLGRDDQLGPGTEALLREAGVTNVARIAEPDAFALSARVAEEVRSYSEAPGLERVFLAVGDHAEPSRAWPDALSAGALAALTKAPVLLTRSDELPEAVGEVLRALAPPLVQVIGGPGAVADGVEAAAREAAGGQSARLAGSNRFATSVAVADEAVRLGLSAPRAWLATGHAFPDALAAGPAAAREGAALVLVDGREPGGAPEPEEWLRGRGVSDAIAVGGAAAITEEVRSHLARLLAG